MFNFTALEGKLKVTFCENKNKNKQQTITFTVIFAETHISFTIPVSRYKNKANDVVSRTMYVLLRYKVI